MRISYRWDHRIRNENSTFGKYSFINLNSVINDHFSFSRGKLSVWRYFVNCGGVFCTKISFRFPPKLRVHFRNKSGHLCSNKMNTYNATGQAIEWLVSRWQRESQSTFSVGLYSDSLWRESERRNLGPMTSPAKWIRNEIPGNHCYMREEKHPLCGARSPVSAWKLWILRYEAIDTDSKSKNQHYFGGKSYWKIPTVSFSNTEWQPNN